MLSRALIVLLVVLNLGVAAWWMTRGDRVATDTSIPQPANVPRLQLLRESPGVTRSTPAMTAPSAMALPDGDAAPDAAPDAVADAQPPVAEPASGAPATAVDRCLAIGPFDAAGASAARAWLQARVERVSERRVAATAPRAWRVWMPPRANRDAAQAEATRVGAAGFKDYFILSGDDANGIALGRYTGEATARQRETTLRAAGFADAVAEPVGGSPAQVWFDVALAQALTPAAMRSGTGAAQVDAVDCADVSRPPADAPR